MKVLCKKTYYHSIKFEKGKWYDVDDESFKHPGSYFIRTLEGQVRTGSGYSCGSLFIDDNYDGERKYFKGKEFSKYFYTLKNSRKEKLLQLESIFSK